jgi:two-component system, NtrC family, sensor kinase
MGREQRTAVQRSDRIEKRLDPTAGAFDGFPQDLSRVLLNLISNGFYATHKRKQAGNRDGFEPMIEVSTRGTGSTIEIRVRDNGIGIPPEVRDRLFTPFFTTKPPGEGTGLGLSLSYDIVVKQHGGEIEVESEPGSYTEFVVTIPRQAPRAAGKRETATVAAQ